MEEEETPRRRIRRRSYSGTGINDSSSNYGSVGDEVDEAVDIDGQVEDLAQNTGSRLVTEDDPMSEEIRRRPGRTNQLEKELRIRLVQRMLMRDHSVVKIAEALGVSTTTVQCYRQEISKRLRQKAAEVDLNQLIGEGMAFYHEVQSIGLKTADNASTPTNLKLAALRTSLTAKNDMHRFLNAAGVFDVLQFQPKESNSNDDIKQLVNATRALLAEDDENDEEQHQHINN